MTSVGRGVWSLPTLAVCASVGRSLDAQGQVGVRVLKADVLVAVIRKTSMICAHVSICWLLEQNLRQSALGIALPEVCLVWLCLIPKQQRTKTRPYWVKECKRVILTRVALQQQKRLFGVKRWTMKLLRLERFGCEMQGVPMKKKAKGGRRAPPRAVGIRGWTVNVLVCWQYTVIDPDGIPTWLLAIETSLETGAFHNMFRSQSFVGRVIFFQDLHSLSAFFWPQLRFVDRNDVLRSKVGWMQRHKSGDRELPSDGWLWTVGQMETQSVMRRYRMLYYLVLGKHGPWRNHMKDDTV